ncbi:unnamed protein product [Ambrosiozyma monospora]|uniref:Unnamed protein product n=1 Tax=Ambrosiozyma monospora TaxID=43982 RepID=A0A9W6YZL1_AMBMO|nr:unnamed protein product [Ambrosiozyma monospora]
MSSIAPVSLRNGKQSTTSIRHPSQKDTYISSSKSQATAMTSSTVTALPYQLVRKPSRLDGLDTQAQKLDIRAHQRTYQGAYVRTCLGCLSFSLLIMKLFSKEFMPIGLVFQIYSLLICIIGYFRSKNLDLYFINFSDPEWFKNYDWDLDGDGELDNNYYFKTSGNYVLWLTVISGACYLVLFVLLLRI